MSRKIAMQSLMILVIIGTEELIIDNFKLTDGWTNGWKFELLYMYMHPIISRCDKNQFNI